MLERVAVAAQSRNGSSGINPDGHHNEGRVEPSALCIEQIIASAWAEVLAVPGVDPETNFFALGGHSLLAVRCLSKLREKLPVILTLADFFEFGTVSEQADLVRRRLRQAGGSSNHDLADLSANWEQTLQQYVPAAEDPIAHVDSLRPRPLSPAQQRLWFMEQMNPGIPVYNEAEAVQLTGELNADALERALNQIVSRHELLRSTIRMIEGVPHAVVHQSWPLRFKRIDLTALPAPKRQAEVDRMLIDEPQVPYDLETEPGIRVTLVRLDPCEHVLILMMHHIICDWYSEGIIWRELSALYRSFVAGVTAALPALPVTYGDYAAWKQEQLTANSFAEDLAFWEETLKGAPALLDLPADRARPPMMSHQGRRQRWKLSRDLTAALRSTSRLERNSLFTIFAAALDVLLYRYSGSDDILLGIPLADRDQQEIQSVVGFLLHTHVLRTTLSGDMTFRDLLGRVQKSVLDLYMHRSVPFDRIVRNLRPERNLSYSPLFQVMLNWRERDQFLPFTGMEGLAIDSLMASANTSKFDLFFCVTDCGDEIWLELEYSTDLFNDDRISRMLGHYQTLLETVATDPGAQIAKMPIMTADEHQRTLVDWNRTEIGYPEDKCLDELFDEQVARTPDAVAVAFAGDRLTYRQLADRANRLAARLQKLGVSRDTLVAICMERSLDMVVGLLGILKAGGAYLPLDPSFPSERLAFTLQDARPLLLLTQRKALKVIPSCPVKTVCLDTLSSMSQSEAIRRTGRQSEDLAYVLYTSGSTGTPKGVQVEHRALVNFLTSMQREPGIASSDTLLAITTLSFDIAGLELYLPLTVGARIVIAPSESAKDAKRLLGLMNACRPTIMQATPVTWRMLLESGWTGDPKLKVLCGGEFWNAELAGELLPRCQSLWNMYGPTETTIWSAVSRVEPNRPVLIGTPIANTTLYVLDCSAQPVPVGVPGELYIGGSGLARGYLGRADLTRERFIPDPFSGQVRARLYKTGDLVRRLADGSIEFLRRVDHQVKLRGFRIELEEIEASLEQHASVRQCVVSIHDDGKGDKRLMAYVVPSDLNAVPRIKDLRTALKRQLPSYMIPSAFAAIEEMPLTANGKVDRRALARSNATAIPSESQIEAPRDSVEEKLVQIWEQLLGVSPISIRANFFDLGGHSLLVMKLFAQMNKAFDLTLPVAAIFGSPTIEQLATLIRGHSINVNSFGMHPSRGLAETNSSIVPIKPNGSGTPLFIIHSVWGHIIGFYQLAMLTGTDRPVYGIQAQAMLTGQPALLRLEDQAAYYLSEIRKIQPKGPYCLLGYCFGGIVAFEIAHQLHAQGKRVELLGLVDAVQRDCVVRTQRNDPVGKRLGRRVARFLNNFGPLPFREKAAYLPKRLFTRTLRLIYSAAPSVGIRSVPSYMKNVEEICSMAEMNYQARPWPGPVTLFRASVQVDPRLPSDMGWAPLARDGVEVYEVPGDHFQIFGEPNVRVLAERLRERLVRSDAVGTQLPEPAHVLVEGRSSAQETTMRHRILPVESRDSGNGVEMAVTTHERQGVLAA